MKGKTNFDEIYETYKLDIDKVKFIDGVKYFRIIDKNKIHHYQIIALPKEVFNISGNTLRDDKGNKFTVGSPVHYSFRGKVPNWYLETTHVLLDGISIDEIGEYVTLII